MNVHPPHRFRSIAIDSVRLVPVALSLFVLSLVSLLLAACQPAQPASQAPPAPKSARADQDTQAALAPSAVRLQNIGGALLQYYLINKKLPPLLSDLQTLSDIDTPLIFDSPESGKPYLYYPNGLASADQEKYIVVCDPSPNRDGNRWCLLLTPIRPGASISTDVLPVPELAFRNYQAAGQ